MARAITIPEDREQVRTHIIVRDKNTGQELTEYEAVERLDVLIERGTWAVVTAGLNFADKFIQVESTLTFERDE